MVATVHRGDVWWFEPPNKKGRPYVILTRSALVPHLSELVAAPLTRRARGIATEVPLDPSDGVPAKCIVSLDNTSLVPRAFLTRRLTTLGPERMAAVCQALRVATDC